ncbi:hypothetical protein [Spirosoma fluviale]|uniref:hypothetical protein n=1 Tax=Spirosoma fluviale TaxID=1597977 RepID=UPI001FE8C02D|nr:hypothetical protein [Spirosoma fluviale]
MLIQIDPIAQGIAVVDVEAFHYLAWCFSAKEDTKDGCFFQLLTVLKAGEQVAGVLGWLWCSHQ